MDPYSVKTKDELADMASKIKAASMLFDVESDWSEGWVAAWSIVDRVLNGAS